MTEITPQMIRILTHDFLIKGITAREAVRRILDEVEKNNGR